MADPLAPDPNNIVDFATAFRNGAAMRAVNALDDDPDEAAQAQAFSTATSVPAAVIASNLDQFKKRHQQNLAGDIVKSSTHLQDYIASHPLAAQTSNDDWGNLGDLGQSMDHYHGFGPSILSKFRRVLGPEPLLHGYEPEPGKRIPGRLEYSAEAGLRSVVDLAMRVMNAPFELAGQAGGMIAKSLGAKEETGENIVNAFADPALLASLQGIPIIGPLGQSFAAAMRRAGEHVRRTQPENKALLKSVDDATTAAEVGQPWLDRGELPPQGLDPTWDKIHKEVARDATKAFADVLAKTTASNTAQRSGEVFKAFLDTWPEASIGIKAEAIKKLYGDKLPEAGDGLFGDIVPDLQAQLDHGLPHGGDVQIPLNDFLSKLKDNPNLEEVMKDLRDDTRMHPGLMTVNEAKEMEAPEAPKYKLVPTEEPTAGEGGERFHHLDIVDEEGKTVSGIDLTEKADKNLWIDDWPGTGKGSLGTRAIAQIRDQLRAKFPEAKTISGIRVSGAREENPVRVVMDLRQAYRLEPPKGWDVVGGSVEKDERFTGKQFGLEKVEPLDKTAKDHRGNEIKLKGKLSIADAIDGIDREGLTGIHKDLFDFFAERLKKVVGDVPIYIADPAGMDAHGRSIGRTEKGGGVVTPGFYTGSHHAIFMDERTLSGGVPYEFGASIIIHEATHALTHKAIEESPRLKDIITKAQKEVRDFLKEVDPDALKDELVAYGLGANPHEFMTQAISHGRTREILASTPISPALSKRLGLQFKGKTIWDAIREVFRGIMEKAFGVKMPETMMDAVIKLEQEFEEHYAQRGKAAAGEAEAPTSPRIKDKDRPANYGIPAARQKIYSDLLAKREAEDAEFQRTRGEALERQRQTKEWKEAYDTVRNEMRTSLATRPDLAADRLLREGVLYDQKVGKVAFERSTIPEELRAGLPEEYIRDKGVNPANIAGVFGYGSGAQLVEALTRLEEERKLEDLTPKAHFNKILNAEAEREVRRQLGSLEDNIIDAAKDHILSQTQMDLLHEEIQALAFHAGKEGPPETRGEAERNAKIGFDKKPIGSHSSSRYLDDARKAGLLVEMGLLEKDPAEALKAKQQQWLAMYNAKLARQVEKLKQQFDNRAARWQQRDPPGVQQKDALWIHDILSRIGLQPKRPPQDWERQRGLQSPSYATLRDYSTAVNSAHDLYAHDPYAMPVGQQVPIADFLLDEGYRKPVDAMTFPEFQDTFNSLKAIDKYSRDEGKLLTTSDKMELADAVDGIDQRIVARMEGKKLSDSATQERSVKRIVGSGLLTEESRFLKLDAYNPRGPLSQLLRRPVMEGRYQLARLDKEFKALLDDHVGDFPEPDKPISNNLFLDRDGRPIQMTRGNLLVALSNMGNELQRKKLVMGWGIAKTEADVPGAVNAVWKMMAREGFTRDDLSRAQRLGEVFSRAFTHSERAYTDLNGVAPARIPLYEVETPWGTAKEWYHPLIADPLRNDPLTPDMMRDESGFFRPSPASGYTKARTGTVYRIHLDMAPIPWKLKQILTDAAMRVPITEVAKVVYDKDFAWTYKNYVGPEYYDSLKAWLKDSAGNRQWQPVFNAALEQGVSALQRNLSTFYIGFGASTFLKHGPTAAVFSAHALGIKNAPAFLAEMAAVLARSPGAVARAEWAMKSSEELQNRMHSVAETLSGSDIAEVGGGSAFTDYSPVKGETYASLRRKLADAQEQIRYYGHWPVGMSDLISARASWIIEYQRLEAEHPEWEHVDLVDAADTMVRRTHGSSLLASRPALLRSTNAFVRMLAPYYGFVNNALNRTYEFGGKAKILLKKDGITLPGMPGFPEETYGRSAANVRDVIGGFFVYGVMASVIETGVEKLLGQEAKEGPGWLGHVAHWGKLLGGIYPNMIPGIRDMTNFIGHGYDPALGLWGAVGRNIAEPVKHMTFTGWKTPGDVFKDVNTVIGTMKGITTNSVGNAGKYIINHLYGKEHPQNIGQAAYGLYHGTSQEPRR